MILTIALGVKLLLVSVAMAALLYKAKQERRQHRELAAATDRAILDLIRVNQQLETQLGQTVLDRDQYARYVVALREQLVRIGTIVTRRPPRRRWLALSRDIAREAARAELVVL